MNRVLRVLLLTATVISLFAGYALAQGEAGAHSLIIQPSARANGMGQCYAAISNDATGIWWNPGGLAFVGKTVDLMHSQLVPDLASDVYYEYFGGITSLEGLGNIGFSLIYLTYGKWEARGQQGEDLGECTSWEVAPTIHGSLRLSDNIGIGMNLKFVYISLAPEEVTLEGEPGTGHSVAIDAGVLWKIPEFSLFGKTISRLNLGACVSNLGPAITYINQPQAAPLPRNLRVGVAYSPVVSKVAEFTVVAEVNRMLVEFDRSNTYHGGVEFKYANLLAVRGGYIKDKDGYINDPTYGLGFIIKNNIRFDWASIPQAEELDRVHRWSIGVNF